jgi:hypothetical protein
MTNKKIRPISGDEILNPIKMINEEIKMTKEEELAYQRTAIIHNLQVNTMQLVEFSEKGHLREKQYWELNDITERCKLLIKDIIENGIK